MEKYINYRIKETTWEPKKFVCIRKTVPLQKVGDFIEDNCSKLLKSLQNQGLCANGVPFSITHSIDYINNTADIAAAVICSEAELRQTDYEIFTIQGKIISTTHTGYFEDIKPAYYALDRFLQSKNYQKALYLEEHLGNPKLEPNLNNWVTNLYCVVDAIQAA